MTHPTEMLTELIRSAEIHGIESKKDHECGDLIDIILKCVNWLSVGNMQDVLRNCWGKLSLSQQEEVYKNFEDLRKEWNDGDRT